MKHFSSFLFFFFSTRRSLLFFGSPRQFYVFVVARAIPSRRNTKAWKQSSQETQTAPKQFLPTKSQPPGITFLSPCSRRTSLLNRDNSAARNEQRAKIRNDQTQKRRKKKISFIPPGSQSSQEAQTAPSSSYLRRANPPA